MGRPFAYSLTKIRKTVYLNNARHGAHQHHPTLHSFAVDQGAALPPFAHQDMFSFPSHSRAHHLSFASPCPSSCTAGMASSSGSQASLPTAPVQSSLAPATTDSISCSGAPFPSLLSDQFHRRLMPFQKEGIAFGVKNQGRLLIADEMGLGKTLQAIGVMLHFHQDFPAMVVVPSSVKFSWATELERWTKLDPARIRMVRSRNDVEALRDADVVLLTYGMLSLSAPVVDALQRAKPQVVVLDESHSIKSQNSQRNQLLSPILKQVGTWYGHTCACPSACPMWMEVKEHCYLFLCELSLSGLYSCFCLS